MIDLFYAPSPIHALAQPVVAYAKQIGHFTNTKYSVVSIPEGSRAHQLGYRFLSVKACNLPQCIADGATLHEEVTA